MRSWKDNQLERIFQEDQISERKTENTNKNTNKKHNIENTSHMKTKR